MGEWDGDGNLNVDPDFVDEQNGNYHLSLYSPCFNQGDPVFEPFQGQTDIDGDKLTTLRNHWLDDIIAANGG